MDGEAEAVDTGLGGIVAQLDLDLAVGGVGGGVIVHDDVGLGGGGQVGTGHAGTLLQDGVPVLVGLLHQSLGGGHQQALGQLTDGQAGLLDQIVLTDVLGHDGGDTGHLGSGHGGTGHALVALTTGDHAVDGVDVAAGGGDLGLHLQRVGDTPGGEVGHLIELGGGVGAVLVEEGAVHGGNAQGVGVGAGGAAGGEADVLHIQVVVGGVVPGVGVTGGDGHHGVGLLQGGEQIGVGGVEGEAGAAGTQGQVDGVTAQDDGVLDGGHVVGVVSTAVGTEDLHGDDLGVGGLTLDVGVLQSLGEGAVTHGDPGVGGGDALNVGAMLALLVVVVGDLVVAVDVVVAEGDLLVVVQAVSLQALDVQELQLGGDLLQIQQIQLGVVLLDGLALSLGVQREGVGQALGGEGLVIGVDTGIDDGNTAACTGVAGLPDIDGAGHDGGGDLIGVQLLLGALGHHGRLVDVLQDDLGDAGNGLDLGNVAEADIGGDQVGGQGQIPDHVQLIAGGPLDLCGQVLLPGLQLGAVGHRLGALGHVHGGEAGVEGGSVLQDDGDTDQVRIGVDGGRLLGRSGLAQNFQTGSGAALGEADCIAGAGGSRRGSQAQHHCNGQHQGKNALGQVCFHVSSSFLAFSPCPHRADTCLSVYKTKKTV